MPLLTDWNCRNCFSSAHGGWEGTSTSVPSSCSRYWFCFLPRLPCLFCEFVFPFTPSALHPCLLFLPGRSFYFINDFFFHRRLLFTWKPTPYSRSATWNWLFLGFTPQHQQAYSPHFFSTFLQVLKRRICLSIKSFFLCLSFSLFSWP